MEAGLEERATPEWSSWIVRQRGAIERAAARRLGDAVPGAASAESEALRRFRSFAASALRRGDESAPSIDGLRLDADRAGRVLEAWCEAAVEVAGDEGPALRAELEPLARRFRAALLGADAAREARRARTPRRRAVVSAIDRIADAFLAIDLEGGAIADANPAAAALLRTPRETLLGASARRFVHRDTGRAWGDELEALVESPEPRRFRAILVDALVRPFAVEVHATRAVVKGRTLALVVARVI